MKHLRHYLRRRCRGPRLLVLATVIMMSYLVSFQPLLQGWLKPALGATPCREPITQRHLLSEGEESTTAEEEVDQENGTKPVEKKDPLFPKDLFTLEERRQGAVSLHVLGMIYMFVALAIVCDEFFVPSLDVIIERLEIQDDVAGATFMAAGGSAPELFTSVIGVFVSFDDVGIGTIVGSAVFNILFVIGMCSLFSKTILQLTWWPLFRDVTFYSASLIILIVFFLDNNIYWYEALLLLGVYVLYVFFMKWNVQVEQWVKKHLNKNKVARVSSADQLVSGEAGRRANTPVTHAGSKFRHGLLQLMISSIDPMHDGSSSSGVVDAKATQNHAIASLKVLLDATKTSSTAGTPTGSELNKPQEGLGPNASVQESGDSGQYSQETEMSQLNSRNNSNDNDDLKEETSTTNCRPDRSSRRLSGEPVILRRPSMEAAMQHNHLNHLSPMDAIAPPLATDTGAANPDGKEEEEENEPLDLSWPEGARKRITYVILLPLVLPLWITLPDTRRPEKRKWFAMTFLGSILWIAIFSYLMVWWASQVGETIGIPNEVMGLTFLAAGTSIPDLITSVIVARKGLGDMAVSSSIGSNIFDVTVGLPFPWFLYGLVKLGEPVLVSSKGMACSIVILFLMLLFVIMTIACFKWRMNRGLGIIMFVLYFVFVAVSLLFEYKVWVCPL